VTSKAIRAALMTARSEGGVVNHNPSEAQKRSGNYAKEHISFQGLPISIENKKGSIRRGRDANGRPWEATLPADYGYIKRTLGADGDHVDAYVGPNPQSKLVFVVNQLHHPTRRFDEHKVMLGFETERQARDAYCAAFSDGKGAQRLGSLETMSLDAFRHWLKHGHTGRRANGRDIVDRALALTRA